MKIVAAYLCGLVFSLGLGISGMTSPAKVLGFLDITGQWDPSLVFVMVGAVGVTSLLFPLILRRHRPILADKFELPNKTEIDRNLLTGAALFGIGWGLSGYCPGPALVSLVTATAPILVFSIGMFAGFFLARR